MASPPPSTDASLDPTLFPPGPPSPPKALLPQPPAGPGFDEETRALLHRRLLFCHVIIALMCLALLLVTAADHDRAHGASPAVGAAVNAFILLYSAAGAAWLWRNPGLSRGGLRAAEVAFFGVCLSLLAAAKVEAIVSLPTESPDPRFAHLAADRVTLLSTLPFYFAIMHYGVLIPNTRRRVLLMVLGMSAIPLLATVVGAALNPAFRPFAPQLLVVTVLGLLLAGAGAVFSSVRINTLQRQAYEARRDAQHVGPYQLKRLLGKGGMGAVYLAEHRLLKRPCAVKIIHPEMSADRRCVARFAREVQAVTSLTHLHTVRVYDYGQADDGTFYYVMEYLDGQTLEVLIRRDGPLAPGRAVRLLRQVCGALAEAHAAGLVHRDLKPANLFIATLGGQKDVAKLLDFGLVQDLAATDEDGRLTRTGTVLGTPAYMSPEQAGGEPTVDGRSDLYSFGAVAFYALTGRPPFDAGSVGKLLSAHLTQTPPRADEVRSVVPADLADVIERCLAKAQADRYQSAGELDAALAACAVG
jgi:serine/threonine-protein kinase